MGWRPPAPEIVNGWRPSTNWLPSGLEAQNRLEATSHQKLATDGASPKLAPTHTTRLVPNHFELGQPTYAGSTHHLVARAYRGGGVVYTNNLTISHKMPTELGWQVILIVSKYYSNL